MMKYAGKPPATPLSQDDAAAVKQAGLAITESIKRIAFWSDRVEEAMAALVADPKNRPSRWRKCARAIHSAASGYASGYEAFVYSLKCARGSYVEPAYEKDLCTKLAQKSLNFISSQYSSLSESVDQRMRELETMHRKLAWGTPRGNPTNFIWGYEVMGSWREGFRVKQVGFKVQGKADPGFVPLEQTRFAYILDEMRGIDARLRMEENLNFEAGQLREDVEAREELAKLKLGVEVSKRGIELTRDQ